MKHISIFLFVIVSLLTSCSNGFEELNDNSNSPSEINPGLLLPTILFESATDHIYQNIFFVNDHMQYTAPYQFTNYDRYLLTDANGAGYYTFNLWAISYKQAANLNQMYKLAEEVDAKAYMAVADIMKSLLYSITVDVYKMAPYFEAGLGDEQNFTATYNTQEEIYNDIYKKLENANAMLAKNPTFDFGGDYLFAGESSKWQKFCNSLYIRLLMRTTDVRSASITKIAEIVNNPTKYPLFESSTDDAIYDFSSASPNTSPVNNGRDYDFLLHRASKKLVDTLKNYNDPRLDIYFTTPTAGGDHEGLPNGMTIVDAGGYLGDALSKTSSVNYARFFTDRGGADAMFMTCSELQFILAEAAARGYINGSAKEYYNAGITASFNQWGLSNSTTYTNNEKVVFQNEKAREQIALQKWIALFNNSIEMWSDWQRTRLPKIIPGPEAAINNDGLVPVRLPFPALEQSLNQNNYNEAVKKLGGDDINIQSWWDVN